jgi:RNA polymerase sigma-70 factor (ECF subfamily)
VQDIHAAEDIVQEAFARIWASPRTPSASAEFRRWLYRVITNLARDYHRHRKLTVRIQPTAVLPDPVQEAERRAGDPTLIAAVQALALRERQALYLRYFEDLPFSETARILGLPNVTVRVVVHRALLKLRRRLLAVDMAHEVLV